MMNVRSLRAAYAAGASPEAILVQTLERIDAVSDPAIWLSRVPAERVRDVARRLGALAPAERQRLPLFGVPYAVKDNIDVAGMPTTAACPAFAYVPERSAPAVALLEAAGAILLGKTNMDQFATGLVGTRSPYGTPANPSHPDYIPGGSSSGSAVAVARGLVAFALGTDTAGSGRVPAGFTGTIGLKPTRGRVSTRGVVPACRSLDCVSVFAATLDDARLVLETIAIYDPEDPFARRVPRGRRAKRTRRFGVPREDQRLFFGDAEARANFDAAIAACAALGPVQAVDMAPFFAAGQLLYDGPFVAERFAALGAFIGEHGDDVLEVTRTIVESGRDYSAADAFRAQYALAEHARAAETVFETIDVLVVPTTPTAYRVAEVAADPYRLNANLGTYASFVNLLDLCAVAIPSGRRAAGPPFGVTLIAPAFEDERLVASAAALAFAPG